MKAKGQVEIYATYTVTKEDEREGIIATVTNEAEIVGALDKVNHYTLKDKELKATADFKVRTQYRITAEVLKHIEEKTNEATNEKETIQVAGGIITNDYNNKKADGEYKTFFEYVEENGESIIKTINVKPEEGYAVKRITLVSSKKDGTEPQTTIIYGENETRDGEITYKLNNDGSISLKPTSKTQTQLFTNITKDKHIIAEFEKKQGRVTAHYMLNYTIEGKEPLEYSKVETRNVVGEPYKTQAI